MNYNKAGRILLTAMLMLSLLVSTGCSKKIQVTVLPEARTEKIKQGQASPFDGWILTDGAMVKLLELAERCDR